MGVFREYDIRGQVAFSLPGNDGLNEFVVNRIARAFGSALASRGIERVIIGYDSRSYSESLAQALIVGLLTTGRQVTSIGLATTPMLYFAQHQLGGAAGVCVTASHNPNGWSGLKLSYTPSTTLGPLEISELSGITKARYFTTGQGRYNEESITSRYIDYLAKALPSTNPMTVVVDGANGIAGPIAEMALREAGHNVHAINLELDWTFPNHEPDPENLAARAQAQSAVLDRSADCGISLDGDGDRLGITDNDGNIVWSDSVLAILARDVLSRYPGSSIVYDVKCSRAVADVISQHGGNPVMSSTGHSLIKAKMQELGAPFAGERSGHFFNACDYYGYDDAIYASLWFLKVISDIGDSVSSVVAKLPKYYGTPTMQAACSDEQKYDVISRFAEYAESLGAKNVLRINGVRAEFDDGWLLARASSNLPALVLVAEATSPDRLRHLYTLLREGLDGSPEVDPNWVNDPFE
jgi:phosphomannomutase/phosphoglucomutase